MNQPWTAMRRGTRLGECSATPLSTAHVARREAGAGTQGPRREAELHSDSATSATASA